MVADLAQNDNGCEGRAAEVQDLEHLGRENKGLVDVELGGLQDGPNNELLLLWQRRPRNLRRCHGDAKREVLLLIGESETCRFRVGVEDGLLLAAQEVRCNDRSERLAKAETKRTVHIVRLTICSLDDGLFKVARKGPVRAQQLAIGDIVKQSPQFLEFKSGTIFFFFLFRD